MPPLGRLGFRVHAVQRMFERGASEVDVRAVLERGDVEAFMKCSICLHGDTRPGTATVTLERGNTAVVVKRKPASVCDHCGEKHVDEATTADLLKAAAAAAKAGVQVDVRSYVAA